LAPEEARGKPIGLFLVVFLLVNKNKTKTKQKTESKPGCPRVSNDKKQEKSHQRLEE
jgi:hypothetical protein